MNAVGGDRGVTRKNAERSHRRRRFCSSVFCDETFEQFQPIPSAGPGWAAIACSTAARPSAITLNIFGITRRGSSSSQISRARLRILPGARACRAQGQAKQDRLSGWDQPRLVQGIGYLEESGRQTGNEVRRGSRGTGRVCRKEPGRIRRNMLHLRAWAVGAS